MPALTTDQNTRDISENQRKNYNCIDLVKFLCSILVFMIHIPPFQGEVSGFCQYINYGFQHYICRLAVPFFFVSSGFLLYRKMSIFDPDTESIKNYCFRILRLLGTWSILLFFGSTLQLWYLSATVVAIVLTSLCLRYCKNFKTICILACFLYIIGLLGDTYSGVAAPLTNIPFFEFIAISYKLFFGTTRNGVFMGFLFVLMGAGFSHYKVKMKPLTAAIGFCASMVLLIAELGLLFYFELLANCNMYIFLVPAVYFLFCFAYTVSLKDHPIYKQLRSIGLMIYFLHMFVNEFISFAISAFAKMTGIDATPLQFVFSLAITILLSVYIERLSRKEKFKWLGWLLS